MKVCCTGFDTNRWDHKSVKTRSTNFKWQTPSRIINACRYCLDTWSTTFIFTKRAWTDSSSINTIIPIILKKVLKNTLTIKNIPAGEGWSSKSKSWWNWLDIKQQLHGKLLSLLSLLEKQQRLFRIQIYQFLKQ